MQQNRRRERLRVRTGLLPAVVVAVLATAVVTAGTGPASAAPARTPTAAGRPTLTGTTVTGTAAAAVAAPQVVGRPGASGLDYAEQVFDDPWDYRDRDDIRLDANVMRVTGPALDTSGAGTAAFTVSGAGYVSPLWPGYPGSLLDGRDGAAPGNRVDSSSFDRVSFHAYADRAVSSGLVWFDCPGGGLAQACGGGLPFTLKQGWNTYTLSPGASRYPGWPQDWAGGVSGIRLAMTASTATRVQLDWMRVHRSGTAAVVRWAHPGGGGTAELVWDRDDRTDNNTSGQPGWGVVAAGTAGSTDTDLSALPAGSYRLYSRASGGTSPGTRVELGTPAAVASVPDRYGEQEYGAATGRRWDFSSAADVSSVHNSSSVQVAGGRLDATNAGPVVNDPHVYLPVGSGIDPARFRRAVLRSSYDGAFDLRDVAGGGTMGRLSWRRSDTGAVVHQSADLLTYNADAEMVVDLGRADILETDTPGARPWSGAPRITALRWDPNEDRGPRRWHLDDVQLWAEWTAYDRFGVEWAVAGARADTRVAVVVDRDRSGCDGSTLATGVTPRPGTNVTVWDTSAVAPGRYWVCLRTTTSGVSTTRYTESPVLVSSATGPAAVTLAAPQTVATVAGVVARWSLPSPPPGGRTVAVEARLVGVPSSVQVLPRTVTSTTLPTTTAAAVEVRAVGTGGPGAWSAASARVTPTTSGPSGELVLPVEPVRVASLALAPSQAVTLPLAGRPGAPAGARGAVVNITTTRSGANGWVAVTPTGPGSGSPTSSVNTAGGADVANIVITALGPDGAVTVRDGGGGTTAHVDLLGWLVPRGTAGAMSLRSQTPVRELDTRVGTGTGAGALRGGQLRGVDASGWAGSTPAAVLGTVTSVGAAGAASYVSAVPAGSGTQRLTSVLSTRPGGDVANLALIRLRDGRFDAYTDQGSTHLLVDVVGTLTPGDTSGPGLVVLPPSRVVDTRTGLGAGPGAAAAGSTTRVQVAGRPGLAVPAGARGVLLNVTVTGPSGSTFVSVVPAGSDPRASSSTNVARGETRAAGVVVPVSGDGAVDVWVDSASAHLVIDVVGYTT